MTPNPLVAVGRSLYQNDGFSRPPRLVRLDVDTQQWAVLPGSSVVGEAVVLDGRIVVVGGTLTRGVRQGSSAVFDPGTCRWTMGPTIPWNSVDPAVATLEDRVVVAGGTIDWPGNENQSETLRRVVAFRLEDEVVTELSSLRDARAGGSMVEVGGKLWTFGGHRIKPRSGADDGLSLGDATSQTEVFDPRMRRWLSAASMPEALHAASAVKLADGRALVLGRPLFSSVKPAPPLVFDPTTETFVRGTLPPGEPGTSEGVARVGEDVYVLFRAMHSAGGGLMTARFSLWRYQVDQRAWGEVASFDGNPDSGGPGGRR